MGIICILYVASCPLRVLRRPLESRRPAGRRRLAILLLIFCAVGANSWFARDKDGFDEAVLPVPLIGLLVLILIPLQILLIAVAMIGFNQEWHVEEERPIGSGEDYGAGADPPPPGQRSIQPA